MKNPYIPVGSSVQSTRRLPMMARTCLTLLTRLQHGSLRLELPNGERLMFGSGNGPSATLHIHHWSVFSSALKSGDIGFAQSYIAQQWSTPDLPDLLKILVANRSTLDGLVYGTTWGRLAYRLRHLLNRNTRANSRRNIHAHYDLGNEFYALWLDSGMTYSSAWFNGNRHDNLRQAQCAKMRLALQSVDVKPGDHLLEIGCGWGSLAELAASEFDANVTGITLSKEQLNYAQERMHQHQLSHRVQLLLQDYRDVSNGPFDAICSIEMLEAVGQSYWPSYFSAVHRLLKKGGKACIQTIVIDDALFDRYIRGTDFIQQYIFPGGCLPSPCLVRAHAARAGLRVEKEIAFGLDYAETLRRWRQSFLEHRDLLLSQGFDQEFLRTWEFYLAYCEAAFEAQNIDVVQYTLIKE